MAGVLSERVHYTDSPCQVSDTNSTEIHYSCQPLLSLNSRQSNVRHFVISFLKDLGISYTPCTL